MIRWIYTLYEKLAQKDEKKPDTPAEQKADAVVDKSLGRLVK